MSYAEAQRRYDAMEPYHEDDDIDEMDLLTAYAALALHDCDDLNGRRYWACERREKKLRAHIAKLERAESLRIEQLTEQMQSATICRAKLEKAAFAAPDFGVIEAMLEARAAEASCRAELQKALWDQINTIEEAAQNEQEAA